MSLQSFINGVAVGLILGVLYAPASGEETRRKLSRKATGIRDSVQDAYEGISDTVEKVKDKAGNLMNKGERAYDDTADETTDMYSGRL